MRRQIAAGLCLGVFSLAPAAKAIAGAWTLAEGKGQLATTVTQSDATRAFGGYGALAPVPRYSKFELESLIEYGLSNRVTLIAEPRLQEATVDGPQGGQRSGPGYTEFGGRYRLLQANSWVLSAQATARLPGTFARKNPAAVGYADTETDGRILFGNNFSIGGLPVFVNAELAQRFRAGDPPNEFRADFTFGFAPAPRWQWLAQSFNVISEGRGAPAFPSYAYHKLQISAVYDVTAMWALQVGGFRTVTGRQALQENGAIFAVIHKF